MSAAHELGVNDDRNIYQRRWSEKCLQARVNHIYKKNTSTLFNMCGKEVYLQEPVGRKYFPVI